ncbi:hypothetical protein [Deinococcus sp. QL22]|uniref:hypothetical protein n=1 Tax=Deinococcus sp. QL22 TaxID=2939437 RepID=UPI002016B4A3|nr:hypothetical protein [Deinococcus sp. QL22]UQN07109.1 hypothetical protein M1R55_04140 [Deinococcus sp. QL22]
MTLETNLPIIVTIRGAWIGDVSDPARAFAGVVNTSDLGALRSGDAVKVVYQSSGSRIPGAGEHGRYALSAAGREWPLMRFGAHASTGGTRQDESLESNWIAEVLPAKIG